MVLKEPKREKGKKGFRKVQKYQETVKMGLKFVQQSRRKMPENEPNLCKITHCALIRYILENVRVETILVVHIKLR